jgi:hypothetical protein
LLQAQGLLHLTLFAAQLLFVGEVLPAAAAAVAEMPAARLDLAGCGREHLLQPGFGEAFFLFGNSGQDGLPGQGILDKDHQIVQARHGCTPQREIGWSQFDQISPAHACCGFFDLRCGELFVMAIHLGSGCSSTLVVF